MPDTTAAEAPIIRLGATADDGIAASIYALVERGAGRRPALCGEMSGEVELRFAEDLAPVRIEFAQGLVVVEDGAGHQPDLVISGRLPHIVALASAPLLGGVPNPANRRGLAALRRVADGRVRVRGDRTLARKLLRLLTL